MDFADTGREIELRAEVRRVLATPSVVDALRELHDSDGGEPDVRPLYRELGRHRLLAVSWPAEYGGRGARHTEAAAVVEELVRGGVPDMLHVLSIQIVGLFLLQAGSIDQKRRLLPALAAGERFATVLYTEPDVGSDLAALRTRATRQGDGYSLTGVKVWGLKSGVSDLALCAARTGDEPNQYDGPNKYDGISLFLVDLHAPGVRRSPVGSIAEDQFDRVELDGVPVAREALLGRENEGWALLTRCLAIERTGLDYALKAVGWLDATVRGLGSAPLEDAPLEQLGRLGAAVTAGRLLAWQVISGLDRDMIDPVPAAMAKYHTSETAREVASWASLVHGYGYAAHALSPHDTRLLEAAYREAPGLTLSAGTSEMMLELVANAGLDLAEGS